MEGNSELDICYSFYDKLNYLGEIGSSISLDKIKIEFCYKKNLLVELMCFDLNEMAKKSPELLSFGWGSNFKTICKEPKFG